MISYTYIMNANVNYGNKFAVLMVRIAICELNKT